MTGLIVTVTVSLIKPQNFDWAITRSINAESADPIVESQLQKKQMHQEDKLNTSTAVNPSNEEKTQENEKNTSTSNSFSEPPPPPTLSTETDTERAADLQLEESPSSLRGAFKLACIASFLLTFIMDFLLPMPMFFSHYVFSKGFFTAWVVISFIWVFVSTAISVVLPVVETAGFLKKFAEDVFGGGKKGRV